MTQKANHVHSTSSNHKPHTNKKNLLYPNHPIRLIKSLLVLWLCSIHLEVNTLEIASIVPFKSSLDSEYPLVLDKVLIPDEIKSGNFTIAFEFMIIHDSPSFGQVYIPLALAGDSSVMVDVFYDENFHSHLFELTTSSRQFDMIEPLRFYDTGAGKMFHTFMFLCEVEINKLVKLFYLDFTHGVDDKIDLTKVKVLEALDFQSKLLEIKMSQSTKNYTQVRKVYAVDKIITSTDPEYEHLFRGFASLQQAIYFYMEPMHSHLFLNRSKLNVPPGVNGDPDILCSQLYSSYSYEEGTNWMLANFMNEFMTWDTPSLGTVETPSVSVLLNVAMVLRNGDSTYLTLEKNKYVHLIRFLDHSEEEVFSLKLSFHSIAGSTVAFLFQIRSNKIFYARFFSVQDEIDADFKLSLDSIFINMTNLNPSDLSIYVAVKGASVEESVQSKYFTIENSSLKSIAKIQLGTKPDSSQTIYESPAFLLIIHDLQIFHGGYFFSNDGNTNDSYALSMDEVVNVHCAATPKVYRPSGNVALDSYYNTLKNSSTSTDCTHFEFNRHCLKLDCEICIRSTCLVCRPFYELFDSSCIGPFDMKTYDLINRKRTSEFLNISFAGDNDLETSRVYSTGYSSPSYAHFSYDYSTNDSSQKTIKIKISSDECHLLNNSISSTFIREDLFGHEPTSFRGFEVSPGSYSLKTFDYHINFHDNTFSFDCERMVYLMKGQKYSLLCPTKVVDLSSLDYYPEIFEIGHSYPANTYVIITGSNSNYLMKCQNNCDCSSSLNNLGCSGTCAPGLTLITLSTNPLIEYCSPCSRNCLSFQGPYCLVCDLSVAYSEGKIYHNGHPSSFEICKPCHNNCTDGCTGPDEIDCKGNVNPPIDPSPIVPPVVVNPDRTDNGFFIDGSGRMVTKTTYKCRDDCGLCDEDNSCTSCPLYSNNIIYKLDTDKNDYKKFNYYFCEKCESSCEVCSSLSSCICEKSLFNPFTFFDSKFNICRRVTCPENCAECDHQGLCVRCRDKYSLDDNKCVILGRNCMNFSEEDPEKCDQCASSFSLDFSFRCVRCSSRCDYCDFTREDSACLLCRSSFLYRNRCISVNPLSHYSALQANINLLYSKLKTSAKEIESTSSNCKTNKNNFSKICTGCESNHYIYNKNCVKCPPYSTSCIYVKQLQKPQILDCSSEYYHNPKLQKCVKCPANCTQCDPAKCLSCHSGFTLFAGKCISCIDSNCSICSLNSVCIACKPSFFLDKSTNKCRPCPPFCKFCFSSDKCFLCLPNYIKTSNNTCKKDCNKLEYFDTRSNKCKACQSCEFCWRGTATAALRVISANKSAWSTS